MSNKLIKLKVSHLEIITVKIISADSEAPEDGIYRHHRHGDGPMRDIVELSLLCLLCVKLVQPVALEHDGVHKHQLSRVPPDGGTRLIMVNYSQLQSAIVNYSQL